MSEDTMLSKIYVKYKELKTEATEDCKFDKSDLTKSFGITQLLIKWINKKTQWTDVYRDLEAKRKKAYRKAYEFYKTDFPLSLTTKEEYSAFIDSDAEYSDFLNQCLVVKEIIQYIDFVIEALKSKSWEIKNYIEWLKFKNGQ